KDIINFVITDCVRARLAARSGELSEAARWARSAVERAERSDFVGYQAMALLDLSRVLFLQGRTDEGRVEATRALALYRRRDDLPGAVRAERLIAGEDEAFTRSADGAAG